MLLIFASNTAIIGAYHVFIALTRMGFLPRVIERATHGGGTPHWPILAAVGAARRCIVYVARAQPVARCLLGDLYAFGLLGTFVLTCVAPRRRPVARAQSWTARCAALVFAVGVLTTGLTIVGWSVNLVAKPDATAVRRRPDR